MAFDLDPNYKQVPERIADFKEKHPEGCLRPVDPARPFWFEEVGDKLFLCYAAAAYRTPDDALPGIGLAWEPVPGTTPYTKNSELQNAETSAWGRAIVAVLARNRNRSRLLRTFATVKVTPTRLGTLLVGPQGPGAHEDALLHR